MQIRDKKTLGIDTIFPMVLILLGLWLSTISISKDGAPRTMTPPFIFPPSNTLYYNFESSESYADFNQTTPAHIKGFV